MGGFEAGIDERIWQVVMSIPPGRVASYGAVAAMAGMPGAARRAGAALKALPADTRVPWHRVLNARGQISLPGAAGARQRERLEREGVGFRLNGSVDMARFAWTGR